MGKPGFQVRGVIEGFYGLFYTPPERDEFIAFLGEHGFNLYIYGPKNDRQHRARWREHYPDYIMAQFAETVKVARTAGVDFSYSLGPGVSMNYASEEDLETIKSKFNAFYEIGVRTFVLLLDDISSDFQFDEEKARFTSYGEAHVYVTNQIYSWLKSLDASCELMLCPTDYQGTAPFSTYIHELGEGIHPEVDIFYTGPDICSTFISKEDTEDFTKAIHRKPIIWDNYPVNDLGMTSEMHIGPINGRDPELAHLSKGFVINVMSQAEASKIPLLTFKDFFEDPVRYEPWKSWEKALGTVGGASHFDALKRFSENALYSCLAYGQEEPLKRLANEALDALRSGEKATESPKVQALYTYLDSLDEAGYELKFRMSNYALRQNLYPWIELMESAAWAGRRAIQLLRTMEAEEDTAAILNWLNESAREVTHHPKRLARSLTPLIDYALSMVKEDRGCIL